MERRCDSCGEQYVAKRMPSRFCSARCRNRAYQLRRGSSPVEVAAAAVWSDEDAGPVETQTRADLAAAGQLQSARGWIAVKLARKMDGADTGAGLAAVSKELSRLLDGLLPEAGAGSTRTDELRARRDRRRAG